MLDLCKVCKITLCHNDWASHVTGKKHLQNLRKLKLFGGGPPEEIQKVTGSDESSTMKRYIVKPGEQLIGKQADGKTPSTERPQSSNQQPPNQRNETKKRKKRKLAAKDGKAYDPKTDVPSVTVDKSRPFPDQVEDFIRQIRQTDVERISIQRVLADVAQTFSRVMPDVMPVLYGSQLSGLAFRTSDIDVYLANACGGEEDQDFIKKHGRVIYRVPWLFTDIVQITHARVPVIKAKHINTGIELDISATSGQAVANSLLLRFLLSHDLRVSRLMMLIGYWAKKCNLITTSKFSRYSINLLIVFYLQNLEQKILPPLCAIVHGIPGKTWPFRIYEDVNLLKNTNTLPLHELFLGFFEFYHSFPFTTYIISTYLGHKIPASELHQPEVLDSMTYYKTYISLGGAKLVQRIVCIQDPLELSHNTSKGVTQKTLAQFEICCKRLIDMKAKTDVKDWLHEIINGDVTKPVLEKSSGKPIRAVTLPFDTKTSWTDKFKSEFTKAVSLLGMTVGSTLNVGSSNSEDPKKTKLNSNCLRFSVESNVFPFVPESKRLLSLLKDKVINLEAFNNIMKLYLKNLPETIGKYKYNFSAECLVTTSDTPNILTVTFSNTGDPNSYYRTTFLLVNNLHLLMGLEHIRSEGRPVSAPSAKTEENSTSPQDKKAKIESKQN